MRSQARILRPRRAIQQAMMVGQSNAIRQVRAGAVPILT